MKRTTNALDRARGEPACATHDKADHVRRSDLRYLERLFVEAIREELTNVAPPDVTRALGKSMNFRHVLGEDRQFGIYRGGRYRSWRCASDAVHVKKMHQRSVDVRARSPALRRALAMGQMSVDEAVDQSVADIVKGSMLLYGPVQKIRDTAEVAFHGRYGISMFRQIANVRIGMRFQASLANHRRARIWLDLRRENLGMATLLEK
jgi:hypothetical protein